MALKEKTVSNSANYAPSSASIVSSIMCPSELFHTVPTHLLVPTFLVLHCAPPHPYPNPLPCIDSSLHLV